MKNFSQQYFDSSQAILHLRTLRFSMAALVIMNYDIVFLYGNSKSSPYLPKTPFKSAGE